MALKTYALRLDEEVYDGLKKEMEAYGDPDLNMSFVIRRYLRDLYEAMPYLKKSEFSLLNSLALWGTMLKHLRAIAQFENIMKGRPIVERAQAEIDNREEFEKIKRKKKGE